MAKVVTKQDVLEAKINTYLELKAQIEALQADADAFKADLSAEAITQESRTLVVGIHSVSVREQTRSSINAKEFAKDHPRLAAKYTKTTKYDVVTIR